jgi:hypothetical protein
MEMADLGVPIGGWSHPQIGSNRHPALLAGLLVRALHFHLEDELRGVHAAYRFAVARLVGGDLERHLVGVGILLHLLLRLLQHRLHLLKSHHRVCLLLRVDLG